PRRLHPRPFRPLVPKTRTPDAHACVVRVQAERDRLPLLLQGKWQRWMRDHNDGHYANHHHDDRLDHPHSPAHHDHDYLHPHHHHHHHDHPRANHHDLHQHHHDHDDHPHADHHNHDHLHHDHPGANHHHTDHDEHHHEHSGANHHDHADHDHHDTHVDIACGVRRPHGEPGLVKHKGECLRAVHQRHLAADGLARRAILQPPRQPPERAQLPL